MSEAAAVIGIDLAWGERNPDGVTLLEFGEGIKAPPTLIETGLTRGDDELMAWIAGMSRSSVIQIAIDAPLICPNETGSRPVDKECTRKFRHNEAGCYPANQKLCRRPIRIGAKLQRSGYTLTTDLDQSRRIASEVYPHPATIRLFGIEKTIKYKKGRVAPKRAEFARYQELMVEFLEREMPWLLGAESTQRLLSVPWRKPIEDQVDSLLCAVVGYLHLRYRGTRSEILGDDFEGHMLLPLS